MKRRFATEQEELGHGLREEEKVPRFTSGRSPAVPRYFEMVLTSGIMSGVATADSNKKRGRPWVI